MLNGAGLQVAKGAAAVQAQANKQARTGSGYLHWQATLLTAGDPILQAGGQLQQSCSPTYMSTDTFLPSSSPLA